MAKRNVQAARAPRLDRSEWVKAARDVLIKHGEARVKIEPLAELLGVTTGSFYWHFKDRQALLAEVLDDWRGTNSLGLIAAIKNHAGKPLRQMREVSNVWINEVQFDPSYNSAVRDWARNSPKVDRIVRGIDDMRIGLIKEIYLGLGYRDPDAMVRARVAYFHQVGYYTLHIKETRAERLKLQTYYEQALLGPRAKLTT